MISEVPFTSLSAWRAAGFLEPSVPFLIKTVQAADAEQMDRAVLQARAEVAVLNAAILAANADNPDAVLVISDSNLAGAGDGHTFLFTITYVATQLKGGGIGGIGSRYVFATAANAASLDKVLNQKLNSVLEEIITDPQNPQQIIAFWNQVSGASKGTRVMAGLLLLDEGVGGE